ncbi:MAG: hypothetical protein A2521_13365 [Deltaproteobacteria bacterium RIFOXYD12_FULL_57_12]|nr:MAG: hypothetical protein A2521_13365 [Deltaproteobacteria bacterium RIFOXYD12_FULL_57_12]
MEKKKNIIWEFFASVKLALFTFFILAGTSIVGTVIPQNSPPAEYVKFYGQGGARMIQLLDFNDMYNSWWFLALLTAFSINLIVCSLERLPNVWRMVVQDNLATEPARLAKMTPRHELTVGLTMDEAAARVEQLMGKAGWKPRLRAAGDGLMFFSQKGAWVRLGVYVVHISILIIFAGAIIGSVFGYKASVYVPEAGGVTDRVFETGSTREIPLGFQVRCDRFDLSYYANGAPKEYRSDLTILDNGQEVLKKSIVVNDPLDYKGITFYQASYQAYDEYLVTIQNKVTGAQHTLRLAPGRQANWPEAGVIVGIVNYQPPNQFGEYRVKLWFSDNKGVPSQFWLNSGGSAAVERPEATYLVSAKQFFATGLQVAKDPGVWYVYIGCLLMLLGLLITFFLSHRRLWVYVSGVGGKTRILLAGSSNKNKVGFENTFEALAEEFKQIDTLNQAGNRHE